MKKILVLFAHPAQERSQINVELAKAAKKLSYVTLVDLYAEYPTGFIDVDLEQKRLLKHDIIIFLHPFYWYSTPPILKLWQDMVLEYGFAYGVDGTKLKGKIFFSSLSAGGPQKSYSDKGHNHLTIRQLLAPLEQTAQLCGMKYLPPYVLYSALKAHEKGLIEGHVENWCNVLMALKEERLPIGPACKLDTLNEATYKPAKTGSNKNHLTKKKRD